MVSVLNRVRRLELVVYTIVVRCADNARALQEADQLVFTVRDSCYFKSLYNDWLHVRRGSKQHLGTPSYVQETPFDSAPLVRCCKLLFVLCIMFSTGVCPSARSCITKRVVNTAF